MNKNFSASNLNFWARLLIFVFSVLALMGIKFPSDPTTLATDISTSLTTSGFIAVSGILIVSVLMPIYNFVRTKPKISFWSLVGSANFWIYAGSFLFGLAVMLGINIPSGTAELLVGAAYAKDWTALFSIALANVLDPLVRWFMDKKKAATLAYMASRTPVNDKLSD